MKKVLLSVGLFALAVFLLAGQFSPPFIVDTSFLRWTPVGPLGGDIRGMAFNPGNKNEVYAVAYSSRSQVFKSTNGGQSWSRIGFINDYIDSLAIHPTNAAILHGLSGSAVYKSTDSGVNWFRYNLGSNSSAYNGEISISPSNPSVIYACGYFYYDISTWRSRMAVFKSTDGGIVWTTLQLNLASSSYGYTQSVAVDPTNANIVYAGGYYYEGGSPYYRLYKSTNGGTSWTDRTGPITGTPESIVVDPANPSRVFVGTAWGIFRSSDGGSSWTKNSGIAYAYALAVDPANPNIIYGGYSKAVYKSTDGGVNFTNYTAGLAGTCRALLVSSNRVIYGSTVGIHRSEDAGVNWLASSAGMFATQVPAVSLATSFPNILYAEVAADGLFKSTDFGTSWTRLPDFYRCESVIKIKVNPANPNDLFILAGG